jgi:hypothetical protein
MILKYFSIFINFHFCLVVGLATQSVVNLRPQLCENETFCCVVCDNLLCIAFYIAWWWLFINTMTCCNIMYSKLIQNIVVSDSFISSLSNWSNCAFFIVNIYKCFSALMFIDISFHVFGMHIYYILPYCLSLFLMFYYI